MLDVHADYWGLHRSDYHKQYRPECPDVLGQGNLSGQRQISTVRYRAVQEIRPALLFYFIVIISHRNPVGVQTRETAGSP